MPGMTKRVALSHGFAAAGVLLLICATVSPADWYPAVQLLTGIGCLAVSHVLTPCKDQITRWWRGRLSKFWGREI